MIMSEKFAENASRVQSEIQGKFMVLDGEQVYKIENYDLMEDFFMTITSSSDVWNFLWSKGGITAGRQNADHAIFQYGTADKISDYKYTTGSYTAISIETEQGLKYWEPFGKFLLATGAGSRREAGVQYNIYKNINGSKITFEEINEKLGLTFRYGWTSSKIFGLVKFCKIINFSDKTQKLHILDGARNIMPALIPDFLQNDKSVLVNAYKETDLDKDTQLAMFTLSSALTDRAEPNEALLTNTCWFSTDEQVYLSNNVINDFFAGKELTTIDVQKGGRGNAFIRHEVELTTGQSNEWYSVFDHSLSASKIAELKNIISYREQATKALLQDIQATDKELDDFIAASDGVQQTADTMTCVHHRTNVIFNIMRGGFFANDGKVDVADFLAFVLTRNKDTYSQAQKLFSDSNNKVITEKQLFELVEGVGDHQLTRLYLEYMPIIFSRRHGDPSRPWNKFNIALTDKKGNQVLNYEGNWRDIFQNWEALLISYPQYVPHVLAKFVNAMTIDGFNPYRISREGIDWECPDPSDPWAQFGYWGDHQVIYLQKLLEQLQQLAPAVLDKYLQEKLFSTANLPYRLKSYAEICDDPRNSLVFDEQLSNTLLKNAADKGTDQKLVLDKSGNVAMVNLTAKLLQIVIAKVANIIPGGGIWMNTQRPEWNDANNALAGWGLSVVTLCYLERMLKFLISLYQKNLANTYELPGSMGNCMEALSRLYGEMKTAIYTDAAQRKIFVNNAGLIFQQERESLYGQQYNERNVQVTGKALVDFYGLAEALVSASIKCNKRDNGLYHTYNTLKLSDAGMEIVRLQEMLEGQVAVLSSQLLTGQEALQVCNALKDSAMYEKRQNSFMLYPNKTLPTFTEKNCISAEQAKGLETYLEQDCRGVYHFNAQCQNEEKLTNWLASQSQLAGISAEAKEKLFALYETVFNHQSFTGRSGTFYAYEGLGSIYWHMVAKLLLAVQECTLKSFALNDGYGQELKNMYEMVKAGLGGSYKSPEIYGAFPFDPYSHTPYQQGACQPGMTGQVKEEILIRWGELGVSVVNGCVRFQPQLLSEAEFINSSLQFTYCGTSIEYNHITKGKSVDSKLQVIYTDSHTISYSGCELPQDTSSLLFSRNGEIRKIVYMFS